jgi:hypothetical protein
MKLFIHEGMSPQVNSSEESSLKEWRRRYDSKARKVVAMVQGFFMRKATQSNKEAT